MPRLAIGDTSITYEIRRSPRAKRMSIRVRPGLVDVVAPRFVLRSSIVKFVESKRRWIQRKTEALRDREFVPVPEPLVSGAQVLLRGRPVGLRIEPTGKRRPRLRFEGGFLVELPESLAPGERELVTRRLLMRWIYQTAAEDAHRWTEEYGERLGVAPTRIRIGNQKTLWGSCSARGTVSLNWRLLAAPEPVFEYVVVHELCHLIEPNHGPAFWSLVESLLPGYREQRAWLKHHGVALG